MTARQTYLIGGIIFLCFLGLSLTQLGRFAQDETASHFPLALGFYENGLATMFSEGYSAANTPLPYIIVSVAAKLTSPSLLVARVVTCGISFLMFLTTVSLLRLYGSPLSLAFVLLFYPYVFVNSFLFYAVNFGLLFLVLMLLTLRRGEEHPSSSYNILAGLLLALAVLCQQFYAVIPAGILLAWFMRFSRKQIRSGTPSFKSSAISTAFLAVPLVVPFLLFTFWGGLTHPNFRDHAIGFYPSTIVAILTVTGFYFAPFLLQSVRDHTKKRVIVGAAISIILVLLFRPAFTDRYGPGAFAGFTHHMIALTGQVHPFMPVLLTILATLSGLLVLLEVWNRLSLHYEFFLFACCLLLAAAYSCFTFIGERHLLGYMVFLFLLVLPRIRKPLNKLYPAGMAVLGVGYFVWWFFFKWTVL